jgi:YHS domain-containing protein
VIVVWLLRLAVAYLVLRGLSRLLRGIGEGLRAPRETRPAAVALVRDPVCGTFVVPSDALSAGSGSDTRFFCSEKCRHAYFATPHRAASK